MADTDTPTTLVADKLATLGELVRQLVLRPNEDGWTTDDVQLLRMIASTADSALRQAVPLAVRDGASWEQVGRVLGVSKQAAWERFASIPGE